MISKILSTLILAILFTLLILGFLTPEKDKFGNYANAWQYWTNDAYFNNNF